MVATQDNHLRRVATSPVNPQFLILGHRLETEQTGMVKLTGPSSAFITDSSFVTITRLVSPRPVVALDYQPPEYRGLPPPSTSSKRIYNMPVPNAQSNMPVPNAQTNSEGRSNYEDLYTRHALETFKFGSPSITTMTDTSSQVDPLSSEEDFPHPGADTTPRPSLAVHPQGIRGHTSRVTSPSDEFSLVGHRPRQDDASSTHTFGTRSPASASASSLVNPDRNDRSQPRQETSQEQSSDDEPRVRYHPSPYVESLYSSSSVDSTFSREEFFDDDDFSDPDFEFSSAHYDDTSFYDQSHHSPLPDQDSFSADHLSHRRGSNPVPIPGAQEGHSQGRDREDSVATVKYPTPSAPGPSTMAPTSPTTVASNSVSLPANGADWDQRRRAIQGRTDPSVASRPYPSTHAIDYASVPLPNVVDSPGGPSTSHLEDGHVGMEFNMNEWNNIAFGIKGGADLGDVDAAPMMVASGAQNFWSRFAANDAPRRPSIASTINDTFQKHALAYRDQDWSFRKDKADGSVPIKKKRNTFIPFNERPLKRGPPWKGMAVGQIEYWRNELTGMYKVERLEIIGTWIGLHLRRQ